MDSSDRGSQIQERKNVQPLKEVQSSHRDDSNRRKYGDHSKRDPYGDGLSKDRTRNNRRKSRSPRRRRSRSAESKRSYDRRERGHSRERDRRRDRRSRSRSRHERRNRSRSPDRSRRDGRRDRSHSRDRKRNEGSRRRDRSHERTRRREDDTAELTGRDYFSGGGGAIDQHQYGKYGILRASDIYSKMHEFETWIRDMKPAMQGYRSKQEEKQLWQEFSEDWNCCLLPAKYYDLEKWENDQINPQNREDPLAHLGISLMHGVSTRREDKLASTNQLEEARVASLRAGGSDRLMAIRKREDLQNQLQYAFSTGNTAEVARIQKLLNS